MTTTNQSLTVGANTEGAIIEFGLRNKNSSNNNDNDNGTSADRAAC